MPSLPEPIDAIVMGGGVAGLAAARALARRRLRVLLLEARPRLGGRIDTRRPKDWPGPVERGAEFIHGGNADLWRLIGEARIKTRKLADRHWLSRGGVVERIRAPDRELGAVTRQITPAKAGNLSFAAYFRRHPAQVAPRAWMLARGFVEGFEAAPMDAISARSLAGESMDDQHQYVVPGGYDQVIIRLVDDCARVGARILPQMVVRSIAWRRGRVSVTAHDALAGVTRKYSARSAVIALPLGVLQARAGSGAVRFRPALKRKRAAAKGMGMGQVVRLAIRFHPKAWRRMWPPILRRQGRRGFGFIHSEVAGVPVWWSLSDQPVLVGWAGGPAAKALLRASPRTRLRRALASLGRILATGPRLSPSGVAAWEAADWSGDPFSRGAYSFTAAGQDEAATVLRLPVLDTLFFAGEATADGSEVGTVHGALSSGLRAAGEAARALGRRRR